MGTITAVHCPKKRFSILQTTRTLPGLSSLDDLERGRPEEEDKEENESPMQAIIIPNDSEGRFPSQSTHLWGI